MGFIVGQPIPIRYYHGISGVTVLARVVDEADGAFGAELTLVENAALNALGYVGFYENTYTPDAVGDWKILIKVGGTVYGQIFFTVGGGLTAQEKTDVEAEADDALVARDLDHLLVVAHPTGVPVADTIMDLIMNKDGGQTFARATDSLEAIQELCALLATAAALAIVNGYHDVPAADAVANAVMRDVLGNKTDTVAVSILGTNSIMRYLKGALGATWTVESLKAIYDLVDAILDLTETGGTLAATGGEDDIYLANAPTGVWEPRTVSINLSLMQAGDTVQLKVYERNINGGALTLVAGGPLLLYAGVQSIPIFSYPLNPNRWGVQVTLEQTAGVNRNYPWEVLYAG